SFSHLPPSVLRPPDRHWVTTSAATRRKSHVSRTRPWGRRAAADGRCPRASPHLSPADYPTEQCESPCAFSFWNPAVSWSTVGNGAVYRAPGLYGCHNSSRVNVLLKTTRENAHAICSLHRTHDHRRRRSRPAHGRPRLLGRGVRARHPDGQGGLP